MAIKAQETQDDGYACDYDSNAFWVSVKMAATRQMPARSAPL